MFSDGQSKLANVLFAQELASRVKGKNVYVNSLNPGAVFTDLQRHAYDFVEPYIGKNGLKFLEQLQSLAFWEPDVAALTQVEYTRNRHSPYICSL